MEDILAVFSFWMKFPVKPGTLKLFQASLLTVESFDNKKKHLVSQFFIFWLDGAGLEENMIFIGEVIPEYTPSLCLAQNNVTLANSHSQGQCQPPCFSYSSGQNFLEIIWSDHGLFLVQKTVYILAEVVNRWQGALCNTLSVWRSSPPSVIQAAPKSGQLLWLKKIPYLNAV